MSIVKKLIFALPFLLSIAVFYLQAGAFLKDFSALFSLNVTFLLTLMYFAAIIVLVSYLFVVFANLAGDFKIVIPVILLSGLISFLFTDSPVNYFLGGGLIIALGISFAFILNRIKKDPANFQVSNNINKPSGQLSALIIVVVTIALYFMSAANSEQLVQSFIDSVVDFSSNFVQNQQSAQIPELTQSAGPSLTPEQISELKQNPQLLKQFGLDPSVLDQLDSTTKITTITPQNAIAEAAKPIITEQITNFIKPYMGIIPFAIAFIFFLNFQFFTSIILFVSSPLTYLLFLILEKIGFIKYEITTRQVKKLVV